VVLQKTPLKLEAKLVMAAKSSDKADPPRVVSRIWPQFEPVAPVAKGLEAPKRFSIFRLERRREPSNERAAAIKPSLATYMR
jgi:hypothetical protein